MQIKDEMTVLVNGCMYNEKCSKPIFPLFLTWFLTPTVHLAPSRLLVASYDSHCCSVSRHCWGRNTHFSGTVTGEYGTGFLAIQWRYFIICPLLGLSGTAVAHWLRCCATDRKVAGSISGLSVGIFQWHNLSDCTIGLGFTQPLTEMSTRSISWG